MGNGKPYVILLKAVKIGEKYFGLLLAIRQSSFTANVFYCAVYSCLLLCYFCLTQTTLSLVLQARVPLLSG